MLETGEIARPTSYIGVGDPFVTSKEEPLHHVKGVRQFQTSSPKKGLYAGPWGEDTVKIKRLYEGEPYEDAHRMVSKANLEKSKKMLNPYGFKPSSPAKLRTGPGTNDGLFSKYDYVAPKGEPVDDKPKRKTEEEAEAATRRGIYTTVPKKGGFGVSGTTLSRIPYVPEGFGEADRRKKEELAKHRELMKDRKPFSSMCAPRATLDTAEHSVTAASAVYSRDEKCLPPKADPTDGVSRKALIAEKREKRGFEKDIVPSGPAKSGNHATFQPFPEYTPDPYDPRKRMLAMRPARLAPEKTRKESMSAKLLDRGSFKPSSGPKSHVIQSVAKMNIIKSRQRSMIASRSRGRR